MKPLLRAVLILDALLLLAFGLLFLLTPWTSLYNALLLVQTQPALVGQGFGVALIGLAWLALHASIDGSLTSTVAKVVGHVNWLTGVLMLVWLLGLHTPALTGFGQIIAVLTGVVLLVVGLGGVRLSGAVRRREKVRLVEAAAAERAEKQAAKDAAKDAANKRDSGRVTAGFPVYHAEPVVEPVMPVTRPVGPVSAAPLPPVDEPGLTASERAARADAAAARDDARNSAADAPGAPRPPFHG
ncbi:hypothetical protein R69927_01544 [Paraburkholderia domus]|jgi:hypothetical protein|uniref:Transmembrane protein n=1 Tax=Paraburkholderia domus TaxID=2793075 RepID=A0A9N8MTD5_9BURK|nr:hypothetical protein [Paraburkholderia domus]MBK5048566.1 hypothetical protein [Burkholderia sp. R-70006]MBK5060845.1 hypothetical protein [Burkholderia sp. R-70199]MBK5085857.1 hypothetical protein [Burkholderia sp. R-69927]MBK5120559.1 hypothetical protein [Burkholderia sp. R-69980]MBK5166044.1 hypothetical protein [Burkholderia sp. R-70211]MBK5180601.1 hypothetical protein [Burkholderia sp. R-69749]MCI0146208.1 hypothetical protein [Paraburkholderia sediminicola]